MQTHRNKAGQVEAPSYEEYVLDGLSTMIAGLMVGLLFLVEQEFPNGPPRGLTTVELALRLQRRLGDKGRGSTEG